MLFHCNSCRRGGASEIWLQTCAGSFRMNPSSLVVWERFLESKFVLGSIIDGILKIVSKTVHTLVMCCARTPWIVRQLPSNCRDDKKKEALEELAALMASQRRTNFSRPSLPEWHCRSSQQSSAAKAGVSHLDSSVEKETG